MSFDELVEAYCELQELSEKKDKIIDKLFLIICQHIGAENVEKGLIEDIKSIAEGSKDG